MHLCDEYKSKPLVYTPGITRRLACERGCTFDRTSPLAVVLRDLQAVGDVLPAQVGDLEADELPALLGDTHSRRSEHLTAHVVGVDGAAVLQNQRVTDDVVGAANVQDVAHLVASGVAGARPEDVQDTVRQIDTQQLVDVLAHVGLELLLGPAGDASDGRAVVHRNTPGVSSLHRLVKTLRA